MKLNMTCKTCEFGSNGFCNDDGKDKHFNGQFFK